MTGRKERMSALISLIPWRANILDASPMALYARAINVYGDESALAKALRENRITWKNGNFIHDGEMILCDVSTIPDNMLPCPRGAYSATAYYIEGLILERQELDGSYD